MCKCENVRMWASYKSIKLIGITWKYVGMIMYVIIPFLLHKYCKAEKLYLVFPVLFQEANHLIICRRTANSE